MQARCDQSRVLPGKEEFFRVYRSIGKSGARSIGKAQSSERNIFQTERETDHMLSYEQLYINKRPGRKRDIFQHTGIGHGSLLSELLNQNAFVIPSSKL